MNMAIPVQMPGKMINFVDQYPPSAGTAPMMQVPNQHTSPMMSPYYATNQQPYQANIQPAYQANQQLQGYYF
jgi:hypothetical protein